MPTGYTAKLMEHGQTFQEYALTCARAFGALILMRDDPLDKPIPEKFEPSDWNTKRLAEARAELQRLENMGGTERIAFGNVMRADAIKRHRDWLAKELAENDRLIKMRKQVEAWKPPSPDHAEYKAFMLQQIEVSMNSIDYIKKAIAEAEAKAPVHFYADAVARAARDIEYHTQEYVKEVERTEKRNRWVAQLRESLNAPGT